MSFKSYSTGYLDKKIVFEGIPSEIGNNRNRGFSIQKETYFILQSVPVNELNRLKKNFGYSKQMTTRCSISDDPQLKDP